MPSHSCERGQEWKIYFEFGKDTTERVTQNVGEKVMFRSFYESFSSEWCYHTIAVLWINKNLHNHDDR
jgi:hypothetical protein